MSSEAGSSKVRKLSPASFDELNTNLQAAALNSTKLAAGLPTDISFHRSVDRDFARAIDSCSEKALSLTNKLLSLVSDADPAKSSRSKGKRKLEDQEDVLDNFHTVVIDVLDQLFERGDSCLDEYLGRSKPPAIPIKQFAQQTRVASSSTQTQQGSASRLGRLDPAILHASYLPKPQLKFKTKVDNSDSSKWIPRLKHKYNAQVPLGLNLHDDSTMDGAEVVEQSPHLYRYEIEHISYPQRLFEHQDAVPLRSFEETPFTWIDNQEGLSTLLDKLRVAHEIAVDLEYHSYRSFAGFLCLMQISTRDEDFVVDTLALREELEDLNEVFTDPRIVKVFHGAESDIIWLQQNFNLYIVNLFDTYHASKVLDFPKHGLAALLTMYCDYIPDKRYQLADWRIRPLPTEMLDYARSDTHFLLFIYDNLRNALLDRAGGQPELVRNVLKRSEETALRTYEKEVYDFETGLGPGGWDTLASKWNKSLSGLQFEVFRAVHSWRNRVAREEDESIQYVLPNRYLFELADRPPADMASLLAVFRPVPPLVRTKATNLLEVIRTAVKESLSPKLGDNVADSLKLPESTPMEEDEQAMKEEILTNDSKTSSVLWSSQKHNISAATSSFLVNRPGKSSLAYSSPGSSLFSSNVLKHPVSHSSGSTSRYREVVSRVHSTLVITPSIPKVNSEAIESARFESVNQPDVKTMSTEMNVVAVPKNVRNSPSHVEAAMAEPTDDTIVVVGKAKEKKRKRAKAQEHSDEEAKEAEKGFIPEGSARKKKSKKIGKPVQDDSESPEPFDYASAPNFLDEPTGMKSNIKTSQAKSKSKKGKTVEYGNFPAPPRAFNEVKGGSRSHTFR